MLVICCLAAGLGAQEAADKPDPPGRLKVYTAQSASPAPHVSGWAKDQTPADFLDSVAATVKVRWRQHYRPGPPVPSNERTLCAFALGGLVADSFLALQAADAQQFRNTNQDVLNYCRTLGLGEKLSPRLMSQGKMAEMEQWRDLRQAVVDGNQELVRLLHEQRDDDLAVLVDLGVWIRLLQIVSNAVAEQAEPANYPLCIGSPELLKELSAKHAKLKPQSQEIPRIKDLGHFLDFMTRHWQNAGQPEKALVEKTCAKLAEILDKVAGR